MIDCIRGLSPVWGVHHHGARFDPVSYKGTGSTLKRHGARFDPVSYKGTGTTLKRHVVKSQDSREKKSQKYTKGSDRSKARFNPVSSKSAGTTQCTSKEVRDSTEGLGSTRWVCRHTHASMHPNAS